MKPYRAPGPLRRLVLACQIYLGKPAWAAVILVATTIALLVHWFPQIRAQRDILREAERDRDNMVRTLTAQASSPTGLLPSATLTPLLPLPGQHNEDVGQLLQLARRSGLTWQQADYTMELGGTFGNAASVLRLRLNLPISGSALQVSRFLGSALNTLPHASVESLELDGDEATGPARAARLKLVLLYRSAEN